MRGGRGPQAADPNAELSAGEKVGESIGLGAAKAGIEIKDFIFGEPDFQDRWASRKYIETRSKQLRGESVVNGLAETITQFGVGFVGLGKIKYVAKGLEWASSVGHGARFAAQSARGASAAAVVMDPHEERLSNLVEHYPALSNPITQYLAAKPEDTAAQGRLKNALEGIVMDAALSGALALVAKSIRLNRRGDLVGANAAADEADKLFEKAANKKGPEEGRAAALEKEMSQEGAALGDEVPGGLRPDSEDTILSASKGETHAQARSTGVGSDAYGGDLGTRERLSPEGSGGGRADQSGNLLQRSEGTAGGPRDPAEMADLSGRPQRGGPLEVTPDQTAASLERLKTDTYALDYYGSREAAVEAGYRFKPEKQDLIPWQKLTTTEETKAWMGQVIEAQTSKINAARGGNAEGVLTDKAVTKMVERRAQMWDEDPGQLLGALKAAGDQAPTLAANMETSFLLANKAYQDAYTLAVRINSDNFTGFGSRQEALAALQNRLAQATAMYANGKAIVSNSARALRRMRGEFQITDAQLANIQRSDPEQLMNLIVGTGGNPKALAQAGRLTMVQQITDEIASVQAAGLLWGWKTQVINLATSAGQLIWRPLESGIGATIKQGQYAMRGDEAMMAQMRSIRSQSIREVTYLGSTIMDGWASAARAWMQGDSVLIPHNQEAFNLAAGGARGAGHVAEIVPQFRAIKSMDDVVYNAMESWTTLKGLNNMSLRTLGMADEMVKQMRYRAIVMSKASLEAEERGLVAGTKDYTDFISRKLDDSTDDFGRGVDQSALNEAKASTFQQDLPSREDTWAGSLGRNISGMANSTPFVRIIVPFIKTPTNLFRYGVKLTPGANLLQREFLESLTGARGAEDMARATGQFSLGMLLASTAAVLWSTGRLTGAGPQDPDQKKQWLAQGNRAYSITWEDERGVRQFMEVSRFDPVVMPLMVAADIFQAMAGGHLRPEEESGLTMAFVLAIAHRFKDKTYLRNMSDALAAFTDDRKLEAFPRRMAPGLLPFSTLMPALNGDPVLHEIRSVVDSIQSRIPGLSARLPPQRDIFGDEVLSTHGFTSSQKDAGPLTRALSEVFAVTGRFFEPPAARSEATGGVDLRDFKLKNGRTAYDRYQQLAGHPEGQPSLREQLTTLVETKDFQNLPHGGPSEQFTKAGSIMNIVTQYRRQAWRTMLAENDDFVRPSTNGAWTSSSPLRRSNRSRARRPTRPASRQRETFYGLRASHFLASNHTSSCALLPYPLRCPAGRGGRTRPGNDLSAL